MSEERNIVKGYVVESKTHDHFFHRTGCWMKYNSAAEAYVWTPPQCAAISKASKRGWAEKPAFLHPALYEPATGTTLLTGPAIPANKLDVSPAGAQIPDRGGILFDIKASVTYIGADRIVGMGNSL